MFPLLSVAMSRETNLESVGNVKAWINCELLSNTTFTTCPPSAIRNCSAVFVAIFPWILQIMVVLTVASQ